jgi:hypothetical protein
LEKSTPTSAVAVDPRASVTVQRKVAFAGGEPLVRVKEVVAREGEFAETASPESFAQL